MARLQELYNKEIRQKLKDQFGYKSDMEIPRLEKISVNMGVGDGATDNKVVEKAAQELAAITGQRPVITLAKKSEATFKLREGVPIGCKVTLRKQRMYEFVDRLVNTAMPRIRDFRGISGKSFDGRGNYSLGIKEQIIFPEINYDKIDKIRGMDITFVTSAKTDKEAKALLELFNLPYRK